MDIHNTHIMTEWHTEIRSPAGTPRFYGVRECKKCKAEESKHPAGHFIDEELYTACGEVE